MSQGLDTTVLGRTGLSVTRLGYGAMAVRDVAEDVAKRILNAVLDAGIKLLEERRPDILYLSLTDFIQHSYAPGHEAADRFYKDLDTRFARMKELGAVETLEDFLTFRDKYAVLRNSAKFWETYDWFNAWNFEHRGTAAGVLDLSYYDLFDHVY